jgi:hypothetical protein
MPFYSLALAWLAMCRAPTGPRRSLHKVAPETHCSSPLCPLPALPHSLSLSRPLSTLFSSFERREEYLQRRGKHSQVSKEPPPLPSLSLYTGLQYLQSSLLFTTGCPHPPFLGRRAQTELRERSTASPACLTCC